MINKQNSFEPSRVQNQNTTFIDHFFTNIPSNLIIAKTVGSHLSDHSGQILNFEYDSNESMFKHYLKQEMWEDIKVSLTFFFTTHPSIFEICFPKMLQKITNTWITQKFIDVEQFLKDLHYMLKGNKDQQIDAYYNI